MSIKKPILFSAIALFFMLSSCDNQKEAISKLIIDSYVQAFQEKDKEMIIETFPRIVYFEAKELPEVDSIKVNEYLETEENVLAKGTLYSSNDFGKIFNKKIQFLVSTKDSTIIDVLGFLTRKKRNEIAKYKRFKEFPDLKPSETDFDVEYLEKKQIAFNRINGFTYYAQKAIGERTKIELTISSKVRYWFGIKMGYDNTKIKIEINNNSDFDINYKYFDENYGYDYIFPHSITREKDGDSDYSNGSWLINSNEAISQNVNVRGKQIRKHEKDKISIKPEFEKIEEAMTIVKKYYDSETVDSIMLGKKDYWTDSYNYRIDIK